MLCCLLACYEAGLALAVIDEQVSSNPLTFVGLAGQ